MSIVKMKLATVHAGADQFQDVLERCVSYAQFHPEPAAHLINDENGGKALQDENVYNEYLNQLKNIGHSVGFELKAGPVSRSYEEAEIEAFIKEVNEQFAMIADTHELMTLTDNDEIALEKVRSYGFEAMHECQYISFGMGRLPAESFKKLSLIEKKNFVVEELHKSGQYVWILYATSNTFVKEVRKCMESLFIEEIPIPRIDGKKILEQYKEKLTEVYSYCAYTSEIRKLYRYVVQVQDDYQLAGFVPAKTADQFVRLFVGLNVRVDLAEPETAPQLVPPTMLHNAWLFRPFEMFVEMYGLPNYHDLDPTPFVAVTFCLLFGIMFGDLGQGALLLIGGLLLEKIKHNRLAGIVGRAGLTSMIFGFLFGSVFGVETLLNPVHQSLFGVREKLFEVMDASATMPLLIGAVAIGAVLILMTMIINIYLNIKRKEMAEALFSQNGVAGFIFYGYIILFLIGMFMPDMLPFNPGSKPLMILFIGVPVVLFFMKEPLNGLMKGEGLTPHQGWGNFALEEVFEVLEIILSFVTNSLSYLRVGGFVLSHAGMMLVVMTLVKMTGNAGPVVFVLGNLFVMGLEGLIVGIQTLRLEYYEMFSRYFVGNGKKFTMISSENA